MKAHARKLLAIVSVLAVLLPCAAGVQAQATSTDLTGTEWGCHPAQPPTGTETVLPNGHLQIRGLTLLCRDDTSDPRVTGTNTIILNADWGPGLVGPMWGTFTVTPDLDTGGSWVGTWSGVQTPGEGSVIQAMGQGTGPYKGLAYILHIKDGAMHGRILDPHGGQ